MTITDKYGCSHSITKTVTISTTCNPGLKVEEFTFCPSDCTGPTVNKIVTFRNTSTGGICPITYKIDYGDGTPIVIKHEYDSIMTHAYNVSCPNGQSFNVTMTMIDSGTPVRCTTTTSIVAKIEPCNVDFDIEVCPDGRVNFEANMKGKWDLTGKIAKAPWPYSSFAVNGKRQRVVARYGNGTHTVSFTGTCDGAGKCTVTKTFTVLLECCAKNDRTKDDHRFTVGTTDYKMKYRFAQNQMPLVHNLRAITKLKKKKTKWGISFWKGDKADNIAASIDGTIYRRDADKCNCAIADSVSKAESLPNKKKIKAKKGSMGRFRSRVDSVTSTHEVRVGGTVETRQLKLGKDCDVFRWWTDWY
jgi:hypothetical protein